MIIVKLMGGLGNQMFQYALGRALATRHNTDLKLDLSEFTEEAHKRLGHIPRNYDLDIYELEVQFASTDEAAMLNKRVRNEPIDKFLNRIVGTKATYVREPHFQFWPGVFALPDNVYLEGYWQTEKYFHEIDPILRQDFTFRVPMNGNADALRLDIESKNSVCVNVRRGDFVNNDFHQAQSVEYYRRAESVIAEKVVDATFFVFSDEVEWCEENLIFESETVFVSHEFAGKKFQDYLRLMAACKHFIIPNSSFAWWAVWFNQSDYKVVVAPRAWFGDPEVDTSDLVPSEWIRM